MSFLCNYCVSRCLLVSTIPQLVTCVLFFVDFSLSSVASRCYRCCCFIIPFRLNLLSSRRGICSMKLMEQSTLDRGSSSSNSGISCRSRRRKIHLLNCVVNGKRSLTAMSPKKRRNSGHSKGNQPQFVLPRVLNRAIEDFRLLAKS